MLTGSRLAHFEGWAVSTDLALTPGEHAYLDASLAQRRAQEQAEAERQRRELETARKLAETEKRRAEEQTRSGARLRTGEVEQAVLDAAVSYGSFDHIRNMEEKNAFGDSMLRPGTENDNDSYKVRRGKIGGFVDYFTKEDLKYIDEVVSTLGLKECDWYYALKHP